ncbi:hypothetical protein V6N13_112678 [Hibiscus sabdariffa]
MEQHQSPDAVGVLDNNSEEIPDHFICCVCLDLLYKPIVLRICETLHFLLLKLYPIAYKKREVQTLVYCQTCIIFPANEMLRCPVCQCLHPSSFPNICLTLDQFLAARFPNEYALRKDSILLEQVSSKHDRATTCSMEASKQDSKLLEPPSSGRLPSSVQASSYKHVGVGCDACGMSPILGDRYKCIDCTEKIGYDLCGDCYTTRPKLPGRFNQRHTPEHRFERLQSYDSNALPSC